MRCRCLLAWCTDIRYAPEPWMWMRMAQGASNVHGMNGVWKPCYVCRGEMLFFFAPCMWSPRTRAKQQRALICIVCIISCMRVFVWGWYTLHGCIIVPEHVFCHSIIYVRCTLYSKAYNICVQCCSFTQCSNYPAFVLYYYNTYVAMPTIGNSFGMISFGIWYIENRFICDTYIAHTVIWHTHRKSE